MKNNETKIWGLYPGFLKPEEIDKLSEIEIWEQINNLGNQIYWDGEDLGKPWSTKTKEDLEEAQYALEYLIYQTRRFGVEFPKEPNITEHIERTLTYTAWYSYWYDHFNKMSREKYEEFVNARFCGKDTSKYMPTGSWKNVYVRIKVKNQ